MLNKNQLFSDSRGCDPDGCSMLGSVQDFGGGQGDVEPAAFPASSSLRSEQGSKWDQRGDQLISFDMVFFLLQIRQGMFISNSIIFV
jgi:hypothetical protein